MKSAIKIPSYPHALLSPSKAHMWLACTGALAAAKGMPSRPPSKYATEGTVYHDVARRALVEDKDCSAYVGDRYEVEGFKFTIDEDNAESAQVYVDLVRGLPGKRFVEVDLEYSALLGVPKTHTVTEMADIGGGKLQARATAIPVAAGTGDCVVIDYDNKVIYVIDLKFGRGDVVYAKENAQLRLYAAAAVERYKLLGIEDDWLVKPGISQPRVFHFDTEELTVGELRAWTAAQRQSAQAAYALWCEGPDVAGLLAAMTPGEKQCRWCPLSGNCAAQKQKVLDKFPKGRAAAVAQTLATLDIVQLTELLDMADEIEHALSAVRGEALQRALQGHVLANWKLVQGRRGNRQLNEAARVKLDVAALTEIGVEEVEGPSELLVEDALHFALKDAAYKPRELQTPAKLEKPLLKKAPLLWAALQEHITQSDGKPSLERMEDPRPPMALVGHEFPVIESGQTEFVVTAEIETGETEMPIIARTDKNITVLVPEVRLSFCYADKPFISVDKKTGAKKASYKTHGIFAAGSAAHTTLKEACREAAVLGWGTNADQMLMQIQAQDRLCYHDGNVSGSSAGQEPYGGKLFLSANSERRPRIVVSRGGINVDVGADDPMFPYSGCWANIICDIWPQKADSGWGIRINAGWTGVQFLRHDEAFSGGGRQAAPEEFPVVDTSGADAPAPSAGGGAQSLL